MNCKNCNTELNSNDKYCYECGALVVNDRITLKGLLSAVLGSLGWDSRFMITFRDLIIRPQLVFEKYLNGTRKKYTNPFAFFAIGAAISVFVFNIYFDELIELSNNASFNQSETIVSNLPVEDSNTESLEESTQVDKRESITNSIMVFIFKHYYYLSFLLLPLYAFMSYLVFGRPNNYAEHLVLNAYIQGLLFFIGLLLFIFSLVLGTDLFSTGPILISVIYYSYAYYKFRDYSTGQFLLRLLKFLGIISVLLILTIIAGFLIAMLLDK